MVVCWVDLRVGSFLLLGLICCEGLLLVGGVCLVLVLGGVVQGLVVFFQVLFFFSFPIVLIYPLILIAMSYSRYLIKAFTFLNRFFDRIGNKYSINNKFLYFQINFAIFSTFSPSHLKCFQFYEIDL